MKCNKCGNDLLDESIPCTHCATTTDGAQAPSGFKKFLSSKKAIAAIVAVAIAVPAIGFGLSLAKSDKVVLTAALVGTYDALENNTETLMDTLPITEHFNSIEEMPYSLDMNYDGQQISYIYDLDNSLMKSTVDMMGIALTGYFSETDMVVQTDLLDGTYGISLETLDEDLTNFSMADLSAFTGLYSDDFDDQMDVAVTNLEAIIDRAARSAIEACEVEKLTKDDLTIGGEAISAQSYSVTLSLANAEMILTQLVDDVFSDEAIVALLQNYVDLVYKIDSLSGNTIPFTIALSDMEYFATEFIKQMTYSEDETAAVGSTVHVYDDRIVQIGAEYNGMLNAITLSPTENPLSYMALTLADETLSFGMRMDGDVFTIESIAPDDTAMTITYNIAESKDNVVISIDGVAVPFSIDATQTDILAFTAVDEYTGDTYTITSQRGGQDANWFDQPEEYSNVLQMSAMELMGLAMQLYMSGVV